MRNRFLTILLLFGLVACDKKDPSPQNTNNPGTSANYSGMLVINEGNFQSSNASLDHYDPVNKVITKSVYQGVNGSKIGDVLQYAVRIDSLIYLVVNNSSKILVVSAANLKLKYTITGLNSPRYIIPTGTGKAIVSELYNNSLYIVNLNSNNVVGTLPVAGATEGMISLGNKIYIAMQGTDKILELDKNLLAFTDTITVSAKLHGINYDANGKIWALCSGETGTNAQLHRINPGAGIEQTFTFSNGADRPSHIKVNPQRSKLYFLNTGVFEMNITDNNLPTAPLIPNNGQLFYGLDLSNEGDIYVADAIDYVQTGTVYRYDQNALPIDTFKTGIIPNGLMINP